MVDGQLQLVDGDKQLSHDDLAFDHWEILLTAMERIKGRLEYYPTILSIMPEENTLTTYRQLLVPLMRTTSRWIPQISCAALNTSSKNRSSGSYENQKGCHLHLSHQATLNGVFV